MRRFLAFLGILSAILAPAIASAAYTKASEILTLIRTQNSPWDSSVVIHGNAKEYYFSLWMSGEGQGNDLATAKTAMKMTLDVSGGPLYIRAKTQVRITDGNAYVYIDSIDGTYDNDVAKVVGALTMKKWLKFPLQAVQSASPSNTDLSSLDDFFDVQASGTSATTYTITLKREFLREMLKQLRQANLGDLLPADGAQQDVAPSIKFFLTVKSDASGNFVSANVDGAVSNSEIGVTLSAQYTVRSSPVSVEAPTDAIDLSESLAPAASLLPLPGIFPQSSDFLTPPTTPDFSTPTPPPLDNGTLPSDGTMDSASSSSSGLPLCSTDPGLIRRGLCHF